MGRDDGEKLIINWHKCIELPTFIVYDRLNIPDLIHFSGTEFFDTGCSCSPDFVLVQTTNTDIATQTGNRFKSGNIPYMVVVESSGCNKHPLNLSFVTLYNLVICTKLNKFICGCGS